MNPILDAGIKFILFIQSLGAWLSLPMKAFSFLGSEEFFLIVAPAILWCIDASLGLRVGFYFLFSSGINDIIKFALHSPRPYWYDTHVKAFASESSFGLPSGHSQSAVVVWGGIASSLRKMWAWILAALLIFLIGLSRLYNGVHFPTDVLAGWLIGILVLFIFVKVEKPVLRWLSMQGVGLKVLTVFCASLVLILMGALVRLSLSAWTLPESWIQTAATLGQDGTVNPLDISGLLKSSGAFFGLSLGTILFGSFDVYGIWWKRVLRFVVGLVGVLVIWQGLGAVFPRQDNLISYVLYYVRYGLIGFWISAGAPYLFKKFSLIESGQPVKETGMKRAAAALK